jgi:DNA-binding response OmpR family regulator
MGYVLVVDDDMGIRNFVMAVLQDIGLVAQGAPDGQVGLQLAANELPLLVLLDMRMPVMDGWEFAGRLRKDVGDVPVVVMTAAHDAAAWAAEVGASGYLAKPFELDELIATVEANLPKDFAR